MIAVVLPVAAQQGAGPNGPQLNPFLSPTESVHAIDPSRRHALIVIGLPGDEERAKRFNRIASAYREWLVEVCRFRSEQIELLGGGDADEQHAATQERIRESATRYRQDLGQDDALWVFLLGHGSEDGRHGWFHLPGPDLNAADWAGLFSELKAGEQVFWMTQSASGRFVKPLSIPGRIVVAATDPGEVNETRFPDVFADVIRKQAAVAVDDADPAGDREESPTKESRTQVTQSLLELFREVVGQVQQYYDENDLVSTEHAQLDDNGDGRGSEMMELADLDVPPSDTDAAAATIDGYLAARIRFTYSAESKPSDLAPSDSAPSDSAPSDSPATTTPTPSKATPSE